MSYTTTTSAQQSATHPQAVQPHVANDSGGQAMQTLQNQYYNTIVAALTLSEDSFQLMQASSPLPDTSAGIWSIFNSVPPLSLTQIFSASGVNNFYNDYSGVMLTILPQGGGQWRQDMGDSLAAWIAYSTATPRPKPTPPATGMLALFNEWVDDNIADPGQAAKVKAEYFQLRNGIVTQAQNALINFDPTTGQLFSKTIQDLRDALNQGQSKQFSFDSAKASSDVSSSWAQSGSDGFFGLFSSDSSSSSLSEKFASSHVSITGSFQHVVSFQASPGDWFMSGALALAYGTQDNTVWPSGQSPTWDTTFGTDGNLQRLATELVAVDGVDMTITSDASYSSDEQSAIRNNSSGGLWPFYESGGSSGSNSTVTFDGGGAMTVTTKVPLGNPSILGVNVLPIGRVIAGQFAATHAAVLAALRCQN
jgi:hypothetical protein